MTERHDSAQMIGALDQLLRSSVDFLCGAGGDGHFTRVSPVLANMLGRGERTLLGRPILDFVHRRDRVNARRMLERQARGERIAHFESALLNLAINARDAMAERGKITVETANVSIGDEAARGFDVAPGDYVKLTVTDSGAGMPPEVVGRAFEPFFTTKEAGKGTGLGLGMVYAFVKQSGGHVHIESELAVGTSAILYLQRATQAEIGTREFAAHASKPRGSETIFWLSRMTPTFVP